jgi:MarR family transcriptional regulator, organic hydroperoxide resistance regulator
MRFTNLEACLEREQRHAQLCFQLDDALGTYHGLSWEDFVLLDCLDSTSAGIAEAKLAAMLGVPRSRLLLRTRPLEKIGLVTRATEGTPSIHPTPAGHQLLREARYTAERICARGVTGLTS